MVGKQAMSSGLQPHFGVDVFSIFFHSKRPSLEFHVTARAGLCLDGTPPIFSVQVMATWNPTP
jgi:hypothetical protein